MKRLLWTCGLLAAIVLVLPATRVEALSITPASLPAWTGDQTSQAKIDKYLAELGILGDAEMLYKQEVGVSGEQGSLAGSYQTVFANTSTDPSDATISYTGGPSIGSNAFLLVKDGNNNPAWYLFDLTALGWNGTDDLSLTGFWPENGAISHVTLYGTAVPVSVPEPAAMSLLAAGLFAAGVARRRSRLA